jgi:hypothetical protein
MMLAPRNEAIKLETMRKKNLMRKKKYRNDLGGHVGCKDSITINKMQDFVRVGKRGIELMVLTYLFLGKIVKIYTQLKSGFYLTHRKFLPHVGHT